MEVARNLPGLVAVRDSKEPDGTKLMVSQETWRVFIRGIHAYNPSTALSPTGE